MNTKEKIIQVFSEIVESSDHVDCNFIFSKFLDYKEESIDQLSDEDILQILIEIQYDTIN